MSAFEQVLPFASTDPEQPHLMTVLIEVQAGSVRIVTTDTFRLAVRDLVSIGAGDDFTALSLRSVRTVLRSICHCAWVWKTESNVTAIAK